jgi:hypothetical protein
MQTLFSGPRQRPNTAALLWLLDVETLLAEQLGVASHAQKLEIQAELSEVRRELTRLGFTPSK